VITVAALYVDPRGPYPSMPGVECWDEKRDARNYAGPHPVVAHPPCGPWSRLKHFCRRQDASCGPRAVEQVRVHGGVLEHPADSTLFPYCAMPLPGEFPDLWGFTVAVNQCDWGHVCRKPTWLYVCGVLFPEFPDKPPPREPTHSICNGSGMADGKLRATALQARVTPPAFADFLVELARKCRPPKNTQKPSPVAAEAGEGTDTTPATAGSTPRE
jgi:hypothetical protein